MRTKFRAAALALSLFGAFVNSGIALRLFSFWPVLKWESDSEWEGSAGGSRVDSIKLIWMLLLAYFTTASVVCIIGAVGTIKRRLSLVRLYRDYSIADTVCCGFLSIFTAYAAFRPTARTTVCEEISGQPELLRDLAEAGLDPESCELWFEHAVLGFVTVTAILLVVRLQFVIFVSQFYKQLLRQQMFGSYDLNDSDVALDSVDHEGSPRRVFLLPARDNVDSSGVAGVFGKKDHKASQMLIYAPVSLNSLSEAEARELSSREAWVSRPRSHSLGRKHSLSLSRSRSSAHSHSRSHSLSHVRGQQSYGGSPLSRGYIGLPVLSEENLLPSYSDTDFTKA